MSEQIVLLNSKIEKNLANDTAGGVQVLLCKDFVVRNCVFQENYNNVK